MKACIAVAPPALAAMFALSGCSGGMRSLPPSTLAPNAISESEAALPDAVEPLTTYKSILSLGSTYGTTPIAGLVSVNNVLYGTASDYLGDYCCGTVFKITTAGVATMLYNFQGGSDGTEPWARLTDVAGVLYGTTFGGGAHSSGTVFRITTAGKEKVLHTFGSGSDGSGPQGQLIDVGGVLYGTTSGGGPASDGTVFKITTSGSEKVVYAFKGYPKDGNGPSAGLSYVKGSFYGTACCGGSANDGILFKVTSSGNETVLHVFTGKDGSAPSSTLLDVNGTLYGTTKSGGAGNGGTVFKIDPSGSGFKVLHDFKGKPDGANPTYTELTDLNGGLYGVTANGGSSDNGTIYKVTTTGKESVLYSFKGGSGDGRNPDGPLLYLKGTLFGTTTQGGANDDGTVFSFKP